MRWVGIVDDVIHSNFYKTVFFYTQNLDSGSKQMLNGTIVHEIFQKAAMALDFSSESLKKLATDALLSHNYLGQMYVPRISLPANICINIITFKLLIISIILHS